MRRRYATFDGMRGAAALSVVIGHFDQVMQVGWPPHFFLAVDLFFLLSGFVLALNYDLRFSGGMTAMAFIRLRAIRLWPLVVIGAVIGLVSQLTAPQPKGPPLQAVVSFVLTAFALPSRLGPNTNLTFPLNTVFWTLMLEFWVANLAFAVLWRWLHGPWLWLLIGAGALGVIAAERHYHDLAYGWGWSNGLVGLARVAFSFFTGVALARRFPDGLHTIRLPWWLCVAGIVALFFVPVDARISGAFGLFGMLILTPCLVVLGAGAEERFARLGGLLGDASYAVYAIHYPLIVLVSRLVTPAMLRPTIHGPWLLDAVLVAFTLAATVLALAIDRWLDRPARRWLTARFATGR